MPISAIPTTILSLVKLRLPFLTEGDDDRINTVTVELMYFFQKCLNKTDEEVEDETKYTLPQRSFLSYAIALVLLDRFYMLNTGTSGGVDGRYLKKAKAGTAEAEWGVTSAGNVQDVRRNLRDWLLAMSKNTCCDVSALVGIETVSSIPFLVGQFNTYQESKNDTYYRTGFNDSPDNVII
jgi:hypothetical protein